jgi:hypothetical protein
MSDKKKSAAKGKPTKKPAPKKGELRDEDAEKVTGGDGLPTGQRLHKPY